MTEVSNNFYNSSPPFGQNKNGGINIDAHYSDNMKVKRPKIDPNSIKIVVPKQKSFSDEDANKRIQNLNSDIYESYKKEKSSHEFNFKTFFKLVAAFVLAAAGITGIRKIIGLFKK